MTVHVGVLDVGMRCVSFVSELVHSNELQPLAGHFESILHRCPHLPCAVGMECSSFSVMMGAYELGSAMSVPDREADEHSLFSGETPSSLSERARRL